MGAESPQIGGTASRSAGRQTTLATLLAVAGGVVVVLVVVIAVLVWRGNGQPATDAGGSPSPSMAAKATDDNAIEVALPAQPDLEAQTGKHRVSFRWTYAGAEQGDTFHLVVGRSTGALDEKVRGQAFRTVTSTAQTVSAAKGQRRCARVQVVRQGVAGAWSPAQCETAR